MWPMCLLSNIWYKMHRISKLNCFSSRHAVFFAQSTEAMCQVWEWRCSWSSADRRCSNYIWVINNLIAYRGALILEILWYILPNCLALAQSYDCSSANEVTLKDTAKTEHDLITTKQNKIWTCTYYLIHCDLKTSYGDKVRGQQWLR